jgi:6-phosphogluconolactonase (cycloisomerase 2 family)
VSEPILVVVSGPAADTKLQVPTNLLLGRSADGAGSLNEDPELSRTHAQVTRSGDTLTIEDMQSTNGTWVNEKRISAPTVLHPGDQIQLGSSLLRVENAAAVAPFAPPPTRQHAPAEKTAKPTGWVAAVVALLIVIIVLATRSTAPAAVSTNNKPTPGIDGTAYIMSNVAQPGQNSVLALRYHNGSFRPLQIAEYPTGGSGAADLLNRGVLDADQQIVVNGDRTLLFAVNQGSDSIAAFHIASDGTLTAVNGSPFDSGGKAPGSLGISGNFLVVANKAQDGIRDLTTVAPNYTTMRINSDGSLTPTGSVINGPPQGSPTQVYVPPQGHIVITTEEDGVLRGFHIDSRGTLVEAQGSPYTLNNSLFTTAGPRPVPVWAAGLSANPKSNYLYTGIPNYNSIATYSFDSSGVLTLASTEADPKAVLPCWSVVSADGKHLYFNNAGSDNISVFDLSADPSHPKLVQTLTLRGGGNPWNLALDPSNQVLYAITPRQVRQIPPGQGQLLHSLSISSDGTLGEMPSSPVPLPAAFESNPFGLAIVPAR